MEEAEIQRLQDRGILVDFGEGKKGVRVSIQYRPKLHAVDRTERKEELVARLEPACKVLERLGGNVDRESVSLSGQTIEGLVPVDQFEGIRDAFMTDAELRVDVVADRYAI